MVGLVDILNEYIFSLFFCRNSFPPTPPPGLIRIDHSATHLWSRSQTDSGGSVFRWLQLPISRWLGEKAGPGPARKKIPFFLGSHADQLARVSPLLETLRLRPQTLNPEMLLDRYENRAGWEGEGGANAP